MSHTPGPWRLVWWGNETYPFPLSILADNDGAWVTRDGTVSSEANARLIASAPDLKADNDRLRAVNAELLQALETIQAAFLSGDDSGHEWFIHDDGTLQEAIVAAIAKAKGDDHDAS